METLYRPAFLRDLKKLKGQPIYQEVYTLAFTTLPAVASLREIANVKPLTNFHHRYRVRLGDYRVGLELNGETVKVVRALHRREFYRYFP